MFKLEYELQEFGHSIIFTVTHQEGKAPRYFKATNGLEVQSLQYPTLSPDGVYIRGLNVNKDNFISVLPKSETRYTLNDYHQALGEYIMHTNYFELTPEKLEQWRREKTPLRTRDGNLARVLCTDLDSKDYPILALVCQNGEQHLRRYTIDLAYVNGENNKQDIIEFWNNEND